MTTGRRIGARRNVTSTLRRRRRGDPMRTYDAAPAPLRRWLADAALPWSARSALKLYGRALRRAGGDVQAALRVLDAAATALAARDASRVWGPGHPQAADPKQAGAEASGDTSQR